MPNDSHALLLWNFTHSESRPAHSFHPLLTSDFFSSWQFQLVCHLSTLFKLSLSPFPQHLFQQYCNYFIYLLPGFFLSLPGPFLWVGKLSVFLTIILYHAQHKVGNKIKKILEQKWPVTKIWRQENDQWVPDVRGEGGMTRWSMEDFRAVELHLMQ